jgi:hypothetical protein
VYYPVYSVRDSVLYFCSDPASSESLFSGGHRVFVCGALQDPARMSALLGLEPPFAPAVAVGYKRTVERIGGEDVPLMVPDAGDPRRLLTGVVWLDLAGSSLERIESLELDGGIRRRTTIEVGIGELVLTAYTYIKR